MSQFITLPNGDAVSNAVIKSVRYVKGRGVACSDAQQRLVAWVEVTDDAKAVRVRDIMIKFVQEARGIPQPDWVFLSDEAPVAN
jgi:small-conductance mechanosensitive channel